MTTMNNILKQKNVLHQMMRDDPKDPRNSVKIDYSKKQSNQSMQCLLADSILLQSEWPKLHRVLAVLGAIGLRCSLIGELTHNAYLENTFNIQTMCTNISLL